MKAAFITTKNENEMDSSLLYKHVLWYLAFEYISKQHCKRQGQKFLFCSQKSSNTFADKFSCIIDCIALLMTTYDDFY
jgi:hypothetical protein